MLRTLNDEVLPPLKAHSAVLAATLAVPLEGGSPSEYLLETHWRRVHDLIGFAGSRWREPRVEPGEDDCLVSVSAHHYIGTGFAPRSTGGGGPLATVVSLKGVEIDGPRLQVVWNGSAVHLPPREMMAMLALASSAGEPLGSAELAPRIWPGSALVGPYDVRRVIHRLRTLLRSMGVPLEISNLHGRGYGLELPNQH
jgi:hypothetical protein